MEPIKIKRAILKFFNGLIIEALRMPNGEICIEVKEINKVSPTCLDQKFLQSFYEACEQCFIIREKRRILYEEYATTLSEEDWREMDREDILNLALPGDESQFQNGVWNGYIDDDDEEKLNL